MKLRQWSFSWPWEWGNPLRWIIDFADYSSSGVYIFTFLGISWNFKKEKENE